MLGRPALLRRGIRLEPDRARPAESRMRRSTRIHQRSPPWRTPDPSDHDIEAVDVGLSGCSPGRTAHRQCHQQPACHKHTLSGLRARGITKQPRTTSRIDRLATFSAMRPPAPAKTVCSSGGEERRCAVVLEREHCFARIGPALPVEHGARLRQRQSPAKRLRELRRCEGQHPRRTVLWNRSSAFGMLGARSSGMQLGSEVHLDRRSSCPREWLHRLCRQRCCVDRHAVHLHRDVRRTRR